MIFGIAYSILMTEAWARRILPMARTLVMHAFEKLDLWWRKFFFSIVGQRANEAITCGVVGRETRGHVGWLHSVYYAICSLSPMAALFPRWQNLPRP